MLSSLENIPENTFFLIWLIILFLPKTMHLENKTKQSKTKHNGTEQNGTEREGTEQTKPNQNIGSVLKDIMSL